MPALGAALGLPFIVTSGAATGGIPANAVTTDALIVVTDDALATVTTD